MKHREAALLWDKDGKNSNWIKLSCGKNPPSQRPGSDRRTGGSQWVPAGPSAPHRQEAFITVGQSPSRSLRLGPK